MRRKRRSRQRRKIRKRVKIWGGDQPEPGNTSATGGYWLAEIRGAGGYSRKFREFVNPELWETGFFLFQELRSL